MDLETLEGAFKYAELKKYGYAPDCGDITDTATYMLEYLNSDEIHREELIKNNAIVTYL